jgi:beta-galactosidase
MKKLLTFILLLLMLNTKGQRSIIDFNSNWKFYLGNDSLAFHPSYNDKDWRVLNLPHDWSIELPFDEKAPATNQGGSLPGGIGWYRKIFALPSSSKHKKVFIEFDGIYRNSEVWINGNYLGKRPYGYVSFEYELSDYLKFGNEQNVIAVKVDNSQQPNSRWYSGSGIYRDVKLLTKNKISIEHNGTFVQEEILSPAAQTEFSRSVAFALIETRINKVPDSDVKVVSVIFDKKGKQASKRISFIKNKDSSTVCRQSLGLPNAIRWSVENPYLYKVVTTLYQNNTAIDKSTVNFGFRSIKFDAAEGFFLNDKHVLLKGVCMHHDLGALGAAFNKSAAERQLKILKEMGCNAIRTSHNPPAAAFLDLCDSMGFLVMDEAFDMWKKKKNKYDYNLDFNEWHKRDLEAMIKRDRNHPSVIIWSIGNEIREQFDTTGTVLTKEMVATIKALDPTRPVTSALTENIPTKNFISKANALDVLGFNYKEFDYDSLPIRFPNMPMIAAETTSALSTRGTYILPADSIRVWPPDSKTTKTGNAQLTCNAYDNTYAYWGNTHEKSWMAVKKQPWMAGLFVWSGFDFIGEPVPYPYPARSSYYGIVDLAGFPKDVYYMYQSEWTDKPVLHLFPHWNWQAADTVDVWSYFNNANEVELFLNGKSQGIRKKLRDNLHVAWKVKYEPGTLKAISRKNGKIVLEKTIKTAGKPFAIKLTVDRRIIHPNKNELCFVKAEVLDEKGNLVPDADNEISFSVNGKAKIVGTDNGYQADLISFKSSTRKAYNGLCLAVVQSETSSGVLEIKAESAGLKYGIVQVSVK